MREFDREPSGDLWLILDMDAGVQAGAEAEATQEYAVILAASLAAQYLRQGERRAVGLLASGRSPVLLPPGRGQDQLWRILEALALARIGTGSRWTICCGSRAEPGQRADARRHHASQDPAWVAPLLPLIAARQCADAQCCSTRRRSIRRTANSGRACSGCAGCSAEHRIPNVTIAQGFPFDPIDKIRRQHDGVANAVRLWPGDPGRRRGGGLTSVRGEYVSLTESETWFVRLWRRYRPTTGWGVFLLTLCAVLLLPAALVDGELIPGLDPAITLSIVGFVLAWWLAHRSLSGPLAALFIVAGRHRGRPALGRVRVAARRRLVAQLAGWWTWALGDRIDPAPAVTFFREQGAVLGRYLQRVAIWWIKGLSSGPARPTTSPSSA